MDKCLCFQADIWCVLQLMMTLLNYFTLCKIVLCMITCIIKIISHIIRCVTFRVIIKTVKHRDKYAMSLFVSIHFQSKLDMNVNFTMQNGEWVFISAFFLLLPASFDTQRFKSLFIYTNLIMPHLFLNDTQK